LRADGGGKVPSADATALTSIFIEILLKRFVVTLAWDGPPKYGAYHWEPNPDFSVAIARAE
jgi:hypothetical protein